MILFYQGKQSFEADVLASGNVTHNYGELILPVDSSDSQAASAYPDYPVKLAGGLVGTLNHFGLSTIHIRFDESIYKPLEDLTEYLDTSMTIYGTLRRNYKTNSLNISRELDPVRFRGLGKYLGMVKKFSAVINMDRRVIDTPFLDYITSNDLFLKDLCYPELAYQCSLDTQDINSIHDKTRPSLKFNIGSNSSSNDVDII